MAKKDTDLSVDFLRQLDRFRIILKKRVSSKYQGARKADQAGQGLMFKDYKDYVPGDDFRNIDWRVYARTNKYYVRRFEEERNLTVHVILDRSASMDFGTPRKFDYGSLLGVGFAYLAMRNNEKFEFSTFAEELDAVRARKGSKQLLSMLDRLREQEVKGKSEFTKSLESAKSLIKSKSIIVLISDFLYPIEEVKQTLLRYRKSQVICIQVLDPQERQMSMEGDLILRDAEENTELRTFITRRVQHTYRDQLESHIAELRNLCEGLRNSFVSVTTDMEIFDAFFEAYVALGR